MSLRAVLRLERDGVAPDAALAARADPAEEGLGGLWFEAKCLAHTQIHRFAGRAGPAVMAGMWRARTSRPRKHTRRTEYCWRSVLESFSMSKTVGRLIALPLISVKAPSAGVSLPFTSAISIPEMQGVLPLLA